MSIRNIPQDQWRRYHMGLHIEIDICPMVEKHAAVAA